MQVEKMEEIYQAQYQSIFAYFNRKERDRIFIKKILEPTLARSSEAL